MKKLCLLLIIIIWTQSAFAKFLAQTQFLYFTREDDVNQFTYSRMNILASFCGSWDRNEKYYACFSYHNWNTSNGTGGSEDELALTEFGGTILAYLDRNHIWKVSGTWSPFISGERSVSSVTAEVDGSSMLFSFGFQLRILRSLSLGASINYHSVSITKEVIGSTASDVAESYTSIYPLLDVTFKF